MEQKSTEFAKEVDESTSGWRDFHAEEQVQLPSIRLGKAVSSAAAGVCGSETAVDEVGIDSHIIFMRRYRNALRGSHVRPRHSPPQIPMRAVRSSSIAAAGYDPHQQILRLRFVSGDAYDYLHVPANVFQGFLDASSKGRFVNWHIKPYFPYRRVR